MLITVIIATKNSQLNLDKTLQSLANQTYKNFEVVLIDSNSYDKTLAIYAKYKFLNSKVISEKDDGIADAWNKGVKLSSGDWIIFLNSGDLIHPNHFECLRENAYNNVGVDFYYCDVFKFDAKSILKSRVVGTTPSSAIFRRGNVGYAHPGSFTSARVFEKIGYFDANLKIAIDTEFIVRAFSNACTFSKIPSVAYMEEGGLSDKYFSQAILEFYEALVKHNYIDRRRGIMYAKILPLVRFFYRIIKNNCSHFARWVKHFIYFALNIFSNTLIFSPMRNFFYKMMGFKFKDGTSFGYGLKFYSVGNIIMGRNVVINQNCLFDNRALIHIGNNVSVSRGVSFFTGGHDVDSPFFEMLVKPIMIGNNVVIFSGATIMPGVNISNGAVIFPNSTVVNDVPENTMVGGIPAKLIRKRKSLPIYELKYKYPLAM